MRILLAMTLALLATQVRAELYGALGFARVDSDRPGFNRTDLVDLGQSPGGSSSGDGLPLAVGYRFGRWLAIEGSFLDAHTVQKVSHSVRAASDPLSRGNYSREWDFRALSVAGIGSLRFGDWSALLKGALNHVTAEFRSSAVVTRNDLVPPQTLVNESTESRSEEWIPSVGVGLAYEGRPIGVRLIYERFADKAGMYGPGNDLNKIRLLSLQAVAHF